MGVARGKDVCMYWVEGRWDGQNRLTGELDISEPLRGKEKGVFWHGSEVEVMIVTKALPRRDERYTRQDRNWCRYV